MGPEEDKAILDSMVLHEESFVHWIEKELAGESGGVDAALSQIENPLPPCFFRRISFQLVKVLEADPL